MNGISVPCRQLLMFSKQHGSPLVQDPEARGDTYYNDFQLPEGSARYGMYILYIEQTGQTVKIAKPRIQL